jgi:hypothetical protein
MITCPRNQSDLRDIDTPPANSAAWLNRAAALYRWALKPHTNPSLRHMLVIQLRAAIDQAKREGCPLPVWLLSLACFLAMC